MEDGPGLYRAADRARCAGTSRSVAGAPVAALPDAGGLGHDQRRAQRAASAPDGEHAAAWRTRFGAGHRPRTDLSRAPGAGSARTAAVAREVSNDPLASISIIR